MSTPHSFVFPILYLELWVIDQVFCFIAVNKLTFQHEGQHAHVGFYLGGSCQCTKLC